MGGRIDRQKDNEIFPKNNHVSIFINLKFSLSLVIILDIDQNILDLVVFLVSISINKKKSLIENFKYQINFREILFKK